MKMLEAVRDPIVGLIGSWAGEINLWSILLRIVLSAALSAVIGTERSSKRHSAGLRTFMLVSLAGTVAMLADQWLLRLYSRSPFILCRLPRKAARTAPCSSRAWEPAYGRACRTRSRC